MEVKIKQGEEMIDATIEMVDGVMVVSPTKDKWVAHIAVDGLLFFQPKPVNTDEYLGIVYARHVVFFNTEAECQAFCQKLNEAINQVEP